MNISSARLAFGTSPVMRNYKSTSKLSKCVMRNSQQSISLTLQSRARHLFIELQKCFAHSDPKLSDEEDYGASDNDNANNLVNDNCDEYKKYQYPYTEYNSK